MSKTMLEKASLSLQSRQVKAAEEIAASSMERVKVARDQIELNLFNMQADPGDPVACNIWSCANMQAVARLKEEMALKTRRPKVERQFNAEQQPDSGKQLNAEQSEEA